MDIANKNIAPTNTPLSENESREIVYIIKIGGNIIDDEIKLAGFLSKFSALEGKKILVHGGGKLATKMAEQMGVPQQLLEGRRITDADTLRIVTMVYAGFINKSVVAQLQANGCNAIGLSGADGNLLLAHKRIHPSIDYGFVGDIDKVNGSLIETLLENDFAIVAAPITHDGEGQLLNTNADTIAQEIAKALSNKYSPVLVYSFEKNGVLLDVKDENSVIPHIGPAYYAELKEKQLIFEGMVPKLDNAFMALASGVSKVIIGNAEVLPDLISGQKGTTITHE